MKLTITALADRLETEADAYEFLEELRWPTGTPTCPHCAHVGADFIRPSNGVSRRTRTGAMSERRVWRCGECRKQFSVLTGTPFHGTKISVRKWVFVIFEMCSSKNGVSAREIERKYGLCPRTAWFMMHRIRETMKGDGLVQTMRGTIVADETWIGGSLSNKHKRDIKPEPMKPGEYVRPQIPVLSLINKTTGEVRSRVVADVTGATLGKAMTEQIDMPGSVLHTDSAPAYDAIGAQFIRHEAVNHNEDEYVRYGPNGMVTTNQAENFFSQLKRSIDGTHHHVSRVHLPRYLAEFDYRYNTRKLTDTARMARLMEQVPGHRLTYKLVTA